MSPLENSNWATQTMQISLPRVRSRTFVQVTMYITIFQCKMYDRIVVTNMEYLLSNQILWNQFDCNFRRVYWWETCNRNAYFPVQKCAFFLRFCLKYTKMSLFFFGNTFYKNKETFNIFSPQIVEVCRILFVEATLESIMFYYTFSVINTMFVPCTELLYDSTAATRTLKLSMTLLSISCGICRISFLMMSSLVSGLFSQTLSFSSPFRT